MTHLTHPFGAPLNPQNPPSHDFPRRMFQCIHAEMPLGCYRLQYPLHRNFLFFTMFFSNFLWFSEVFSTFLKFFNFSQLYSTLFNLYPQIFTICLNFLLLSRTFHRFLNLSLCHLIFLNFSRHFSKFLCQNISPTAIFLLNQLKCRICTVFMSSSCLPTLLRTHPTLFFIDSSTGLSKGSM